MKRTYATEFVANNSQTAMGCLKAVSWLVERCTTMSGDNGVYKTTSETDEKKGRHVFVYKPAIGGLVLLCSNSVQSQCYERFHTIAQVSRKVASSAHTMGPADAKKDEVDVDLMTQLGRPFFCNVMCTIANVSFAQWTGALGHIPESAVMKALVSAIHHQLDLSCNILNPDMTSTDKKRFRQVSRSRSVPVALMTLSARETGETGRRGGDHRMAVERACHAFMTEGTVSAAWWCALFLPFFFCRVLFSVFQPRRLTAELLEHMLRADFFCIMQMLAKAFRVPDDLRVVRRFVILCFFGKKKIILCFLWQDEVLHWIAAPAAEGGRIQRFFDSSEFMRGSLFEPELGTMTAVDHCLYLRHAELEAGGLNLMAEATVEDHKSMFCKKIGGILQGWHKQELGAYCRIKDNDAGRQIVSTMLCRCINEQFEWPSMMRMATSTGHIVRREGFWKGRHPAAVNLSLAPLRMVHVNSGKATLGVDMRWLLLCAAMGGASPSQPQRFLIVRQLAQRIHLACIPPRMLTAPRLFIGMPHPDVRRGLEPLEVLQCSSRRLLLRHTRSMGMDAPVVPTHMVEDLGPAGPRLQLTRMLMGALWCSDSLPTDSAHSPLPHGLWTPVLLSAAVDADPEEEEYAALKTNNDGLFWLSRRDAATGAVLPPLDVSASDNAAATFLYGRIAAPARPLCVFDRPGVLLRMLEDSGDPESDCLHVYAAVLIDARVAKSLMIAVEMESDRLRAAIESIRAADDEAGGVDGTLFYTALRWSAALLLIEANPATVWDCVVPPDTPLLIDACGLAADFASDGKPPPVYFTFVRDEEAAAVPGSLLLCTLDSQGAPQDLPHDCVYVRTRTRRAAARFDDAGGILSEQEDGERHAFAVRVRRVLHIAARCGAGPDFFPVGLLVFRSARFGVVDDENDD